MLRRRQDDRVYEPRRVLVDYAESRPRAVLRPRRWWHVVGDGVLSVLGGLARILGWVVKIVGAAIQ